MDKVIWGASQGITSALFFLIQLSFLKSSEIHLMALFCTLFGLMNFFLLAIRRSLIEVNQFKVNVPGIGLSFTLSCVFFCFCLPISFLMNNNILVVFSVTLFLFDQIVLDFVRFSDKKNHYLYIAAQTVSLVLSISLMFFELSATCIILVVSVLQFAFCVICISRDVRTSLDLHASVALVSVTRMIDFAVSSGFGFFLPILTFLFLDASSVGELRTSQNFLSLGNIFASAFYYSVLKSENIKEIPKIAYLLPSLILLSFLGVLTFCISPSNLKQMFGPFFYESLPLTCLLIIALVPTIWVLRINAILVNLREFSSLFKIHFISLLVLAFGSSLGFPFFGITSFGIFTIVCALLEMYLTHNLLKKGPSQKTFV